MTEVKALVEQVIALDKACLKQPARKVTSEIYPEILRLRNDIGFDSEDESVDDLGQYLCADIVHAVYTAGMLGDTAALLGVFGTMLSCGKEPANTTELDNKAFDQCDRFEDVEGQAYFVDGDVNKLVLYDYVIEYGEPVKIEVVAIFE